jgi:hypothetical protein
MAMLMAVVALVVITGLATGLMWTSRAELQTTINYRDVSMAQAAADSGLQYFVLLMQDCESEPMDVDEFPDMIQVIHDHLAANITSSTPSIVGTGANQELLVSSVSLEDGRSFDLKITPTAFNSDNVPTSLCLLVTGRYGATERKVASEFTINPSKDLLHYGFASSVRMILRGNVRVHGPIAAGWSRWPYEGKRNKNTYPLDIRLGSQGLVEGKLNTIDSFSDFTGDSSEGDSNFHYGINGDNPDCNSGYMRGRVKYDQPAVMDLDAEDFNTQPLKDQCSTANLPAADASGVSLGMWNLSGKKWENWNGENGKEKLNNIVVPKGTNPYFKNCTFTGITYIEVDEDTESPTSSNQNGVVFEDCTFEGPVITGVPKQMRWDYNSMEYRGKTTFNNTAIQAALGGVTLMAPNYNVNIGGSEDTGGGGTGDSAVCGLVVGGVVDVYDKISVKGTVVSMADVVYQGEPIMNKSWGWVTGTDVCGSNLGNVDGSSEIVDIWPDPDNVMPLGMLKRYVVEIDSGSFTDVIE